MKDSTNLNGLFKNINLSNINFSNITLKIGIDENLEKFLIQNNVKVNKNGQATGISSKDLETVFKFFEDNDIAKTFNNHWFNSGYGLNYDKIKTVIEMLKANKSIIKLDFSESNLQDEGAKLIADLIKYNKTIKKIDLGSNEISDEGAQVIIDELKNNYSITELDLYEGEIEYDEYGDPYIDYPNTVSSESDKSINSFLNRNKKIVETKEYMVNKFIKGYSVEFTEEIKYLKSYEKYKTILKNILLKSSDLADYYISKNYFKLTTISNKLKLTEKTESNNLNHQENYLKQLIKTKDILFHITSFLSIDDIITNSSNDIITNLSEEKLMGESFE
jgi:hypothetical protein